MLRHLHLYLLIVQVFMASIYDDSIPLPVLDTMIIKLMTTPEEDKGDDLYKHAFNYFNLLDDIEILLKKPLKRHIALQRFEEVLANGGPRFVNSSYSMDDFREVYGWTIDEITEFKAIVKGTKMLWKKLTQMVFDIKNKQKSKKGIDTIV